MIMDRRFKMLKNALSLVRFQRQDEVMFCDSFTEWDPAQPLSTEKKFDDEIKNAPTDLPLK